MNINCFIFANFSQVTIDIGVLITIVNISRPFTPYHNEQVWDKEPEIADVTGFETYANARLEQVKQALHLQQ